MEEQEQDQLPDQLNPEAEEIYHKLFAILIAEGRGDDKYKYSVAIAANSLYYYQKTMEAIDIDDYANAADIGVAIRALNSASSEWSRAARSLLLTPESVLRIKEEAAKTVEQPPPTLAEVMGEMLKRKSKNDNYGKRNEQGRKPSAKAAVSRKKNK